MPVIDTDSIAKGFVELPDGTYRVRLIDAEGRLSKSKGDPMVVADWEVVSGDHEGDECKIFYMLTTKPGRGGKLIAPGIAKMLTHADQIGRPMNKNFDDDLEVAAKNYKRTFGSGTHQVTIKSSEGRDGNTYKNHSFDVAAVSDESEGSLEHEDLGMLY